MIWWQRFKKSSAHTQANVVCTILIMVATIAYAVTAWRQLAAINAQIVQAGKDSEKSRQQFMVQIQHFDASLGVNETQIGKLDASIQQSKRLADATEQANRNAENANRPWLGGQIKVIGFEAGRDPEAFCAFVNGGRRPAFVEHQVCELVGDKMIPMPDVAGGYKPKGLVLPGGTVTMHQVFFAGGDPTYIQDGKMTSTFLSLYDSSQWHLRINSTVTYRDIGTGKIHHTTMCVRYQPAEYKSPASWTDCDTGNYAD